MNQQATFLIHDATVNISCAAAKPGKTHEGTVALFHRAMRKLRRIGFFVSKDPHIEANFKSLSRSHRRGWHGDLEFKAEYFPAGIRIEFFQNIVTENRHGGEYDFDRRGKMPYLVRIRFELTLRYLRELLAAFGFSETTRVATPIPDPLAFFNDKWDSEYDKREGRHRFERDETGWPSAKELKSWPRLDANRQQLTHGAVRYCYCHRGILRRGRCYGGINGQWMVVYGPGKNDYTHRSAHELFDYFHGIPIRNVTTERRERRLKEELAKAVAKQAFERAIVLRDLIAAGAPAETWQEAA